MDNQQTTVKPILHHSNQKESKPRRKSITWDEQGIEEYEKERGKISKIPEAKTPYPGDLGSDDQEDALELDEETRKNTLRNKKVSLDHEELQKKLENAQNWEIEKQKKEELQHEDDQKHKEFLEKRKKHYNEGAALKKMLKAKFEDEDDEDAK